MPKRSGKHELFRERSFWRKGWSAPVHHVDKNVPQLLPSEAPVPPFETAWNYRSAYSCQFAWAKTTKPINLSHPFFSGKREKNVIHIIFTLFHGIFHRFSSNYPYHPSSSQESTREAVTKFRRPMEITIKIPKKYLATKESDSSQTPILTTSNPDFSLSNIVVWCLSRNKSTLNGGEKCWYTLNSAMLSTV